ncbi:MAG: thiamine pyrophosphate-binding protein, partial [Pseudomonadota bacterium]
MRGADLVVASLSKAGVKVVFSLSGNQIMPIYDACIDAGIRIIHTRHEGAAVYMAEAYAQLTGEIGVALVTAGPGFTSSLGPLFTARSAESPVLLLSGDSPRSGDGKGCFQELDQVAMSHASTKLSMRPEQAENLGLDLAKAISTAVSGRPGPVHLALPVDLLTQEIGDIAPPDQAYFEPVAVMPDESMADAIVALLASAKQPVILTGPALNPTRAPHLKDLSRAMDAPVISMESPRGLKDPSLGDFARVLGLADVILVLGKNIDHTTGFGQAPAMSDGCKFIVIDPDNEILERARRALGARLEAGHCVDADATAQMLLQRAVNVESRTQWHRQVKQAIDFRSPAPALVENQPMLPSELCFGIQTFLDKADDPILIIDGGEFGQWAQACLSANTRMINGPSGCIGGSICSVPKAPIAQQDSSMKSNDASTSGCP